MDINTASRADWERRRKIRLTQVRDQSKILAKTIRDRVLSADEIQLEKHETARNKTEHKFKSLACSKLKSDFNYLIQDVGNGYAIASTQPDPSIVLAEKRLINRCTAISRGFEAEKRQQQKIQEQQMDKAMRESKINFNKTIEKIRSRLITSVPNVCSNNNHMDDNIKQNECFLIPSQVILNESNITNRNYNKKASKPWSVVFNTYENQTAKNHRLSTNDDNKENKVYVSKLAKIETDLKSYESLVTKLNKLSAEEQNIRDKLFTHYQQEDPLLYSNSVPSVIQDIVQHSDKSAKSNKIINEVSKKKFELNSNDASSYISSSTNTNDECSVKTVKKIKKTIHFKNIEENKNALQCSSKLINQKRFTADKPSKNIIKCPIESVKKTIHLKNVENKNNALQSSSMSSYKKEFSTEKPLKNINNTVQRIKKKKQLLKNEISAGSKKNETETPNSKISPIHNRCKVSNDLLKVSPTNYAMLPDSLYDHLDSLKKLFSKKKSKLNNSKCNTSINADLIQYINKLLKMTPSDIDDLSISSCSSIKMEENILQYSSKNEQYYSNILNCISKCLNADISDLSQETMFDSPKNINLLNRLQNLTNYYLDRTREMKNICEESSPIVNDLNAETEIINESTNISSNSSVDGEYILGHLNTILQKKGLIRSDKEWPMFENSNDDDNRSLTDQLLDIYPRRLDKS